ncbi:hypothetical protein ACS0TY_003198 [Phlomoides rotata]
MCWQKAARKKKGKKSDPISSSDEVRWTFYCKENKISDEVKTALEVSRKLGLYSKCSDEEIRLGKRMKRKEINRIITLNGMDMCCIQETKLEKLGNRVGHELWPGSEFD